MRISVAHQPCTITDPPLRPREWCTYQAISISGDKRGDGYPFSPPTVQFKTKIWHPNIDWDTGDIGLSMLQKGEWNPKLRVSKVMDTILSLFAAAHQAQVQLDWFQTGRLPRIKKKQGCMGQDGTKAHGEADAKTQNSSGAGGRHRRHRTRAASWGHRKGVVRSSNSRLSWGSSCLRGYLHATSRRCTVRPWSGGLLGDSWALTACLEL